MSLSIPAFEKAKILVVGDIMLDRYLVGIADRVSPEAPVPVVHINNIEEKPGGAGNVALNLKALGAQVTLAGLLGNDHDGNNLSQLLKQTGIVCHLHTHPHCSTIVKQRVLSQNHQLIRLDFEKKYSEEASESLYQQIQELIPQHHLLILSDYGKGTLSCCKKLIKLANTHQCPVFIDPKGHDFSKYRGATLLTPNKKEFEIIKGEAKDNDIIEKKAAELIKELELKALLVTRGAQGMTLIEPQNKTIQHLNAQTREVFDVTGAGDTVIAVTAAAYAAGTSLIEAVDLANYAAGIVVGKLGASIVTVPEIRRAIHEISTNYYGISSEENLKLFVEDAKAHGEKIVFTNGCFDLLHAGHIRYLKQAKALGNRLIVAINDDASIKRLKGQSRPINPLATRMELLASLEMVDWVIAFSEDTPLRLIETLKPDILVKGGDYTIDNIVGATETINRGGKVCTLPFYQGFSSTSIIQSIESSLEGKHK